MLGSTSVFHCPNSAVHLTGALSADSYSYEYDSRYNRVENGQVHDAFNKLLEDNQTNYAYDLAGNLTSRIDKLTGVETVMKYNSTDRLTSIEAVSEGLTTKIASYAYDGLGRRTSKTVNRELTQFQWSGDVLIGEVDGRGIEASRRYRYGTDWSPLEYTSDDAAFQVASNHLMTPTALVDRAGTMAWSDTRGPFGESTEAEADSPNSVDFRIGFPGQYHDAESKLSYNNQRYYDPKIGRYLRNDPIGMAGGMNQYRYAMNNPVGAIDPRGEIAFVPAFFIAAEIAGVAYSGYELYQAFRNPCSTALDYLLPVLGLGGVGALAYIRYLNRIGPSSATSQRALIETTRALARKKAGFTDAGQPIILDTNLQTKGMADALRAKGYNVRSVTEIFGKDVGDPGINSLANSIGAKVLTRDRGRQIGEGFGSNAIQVDSRVRGVDAIVKILEGGL